MPVKQAELIQVYDVKNNEKVYMTLKEGTEVAVIFKLPLKPQDGVVNAPRVVARFSGKPEAVKALVHRACFEFNELGGGNGAEMFIVINGQNDKLVQTIKQALCEDQYAKVWPWKGNIQAGQLIEYITSRPVHCASGFSLDNKGDFTVQQVQSVPKLSKTHFLTRLGNLYKGDEDVGDRATHSARMTKN